eukprot:gene1107-1408_t
MIKLNVALPLKHFIDISIGNDETVSTIRKKIQEQAKTHEPYMILFDDEPITNENLSVSSVGISNESWVRVQPNSVLVAKESDKITLNIQFQAELLNDSTIPSFTSRHGFLVREIQVRIHYHESVRQLKKIIQDKIGVDVIKQSLIFANHKLDDYRTMSNSSISRDSTIFLVVFGKKE